MEPGRWFDLEVLLLMPSFFSHKTNNTNPQFALNFEEYGTSTGVINRDVKHRLNWVSYSNMS